MKENTGIAILFCFKVSSSETLLENNLCRWVTFPVRKSLIIYRQN
jgi:hypothetical protein